MVPCCDHTFLCNGRFGSTFAVEEDKHNGTHPEVLFLPESQNSIHSTEEVCIIIIEFYVIWIIRMGTMGNYKALRQSFKKNQRITTMNLKNLYWMIIRRMMTLIER